MDGSVLANASLRRTKAVNRWSGLRIMLCLGTVAVVATGASADECGPPSPISVTAVCGQTGFVAGWRVPQDDGIFAELIPDVPLQLVDEHGDVVAETTSDEHGHFLFRPVAAGNYLLRTNGAGWRFGWENSRPRTFKR
jgi:hypothetical protein